MEREKQKMAFALGLAANVLWASSFIGSKYTLMAWAPHTAVFLRFALSFGILWMAYRILGLKVEFPRELGQWRKIAIVGLILGALYPLQLSGLAYISTGMSAAIMLLAPLVLVVLAPFVTAERLERQKVIAIFLGIIGGLILLSENLTLSEDTPKGIWLTLGAATCLAIFTLANRKFSNSVNHSTMTLYSFGIGAAVVAPFTFFEDAKTGEHIIGSASALIYLSVACTALPFFIWNKATSLTETKNLASTMHAKTPVAILLGAAVFNEPLTWHLIAGTVIVSFALWLSQTENFLIKKYLKGEKGHERQLSVSAAVRKVT